ncbi:MAG TPA: hypothetical protein VLH94_02405 [Spirochaetia bacterium]|nr:hypothetical protein [Spirochaetia bacterium]
MNTNLSVATIEAILVGKFLYEEKRSAQYSQRIQNALGVPVPTTDSKELSDQLKMFMAGSIAKKLFRNDRSDSLFSVDECDQLIFDHLYKKFEDDTNVNDEDKRLIINSVKLMVSGMVDSIMSLVDGPDPYDQYFKIINTIEFLANEECLPLDEPLPDELYDEVTRRIYTKEEYVSLNEKGLKLISDPEALLKVLMKPVIDNLLKDLDPEFIQEMREEIEVEMKELVSLQFAPLFEKLGKVTKEIVTEETNRLYAL